MKTDSRVSQDKRFVWLWSRGVKIMKWFRGLKRQKSVFDSSISIQVFQHRRLTTIFKLSLWSWRMFASQNHIVTNFNCITWKATKTGNLRASKAYFNCKQSVCHLKSTLHVVFCHLPLGGLWAVRVSSLFSPFKVTGFDLWELYLCLDTPSSAQIATKKGPQFSLIGF